MESYSAHEQKIMKREKLDHLLNISKSLKNNSISGENNQTKFGIVKKSVLEKKMSKILNKWEQKGTGVGIEIVSIDHESLYRTKNKEKNPDLTVSLPIIYQEDNERLPAFLIVRSW